jgi:hypothetical protein
MAANLPPSSIIHPGKFPIFRQITHKKTFYTLIILLKYTKSRKITKNSPLVAKFQDKRGEYEQFETHSGLSTVLRYEEAVSEGA